MSASTTCPSAATTSPIGSPRRSAGAQARQNSASESPEPRLQRDLRHVRNGPWEDRHWAMGALVLTPPNATKRRLATILAIDMAGYSARAERDQEDAARAVRQLSQRVRAHTEAHGGRLFNTAGD